MALVSLLVLVSIDKNKKRKSFQCKRKFIKEQNIIEKSLNLFLKLKMSGNQ